MIVTEVFAIVRELRDRGAIVLLVKQSVHQALSVADRFHVVERGKIVFSGEAGVEADRTRLMQLIAV
jgi:branched-chain amino acid transport system ATP-binding protein